MKKTIPAYSILMMLIFTGFFVEDVYAKARQSRFKYPSETNDGGQPVVYPNPATNIISIRIDAIHPDWTEVDVEIRNILGNLMPVTVERIEEKTLRIATSDFPSGYYLLVVRCPDCPGQANVRNTYKFLKQ